MNNKLHVLVIPTWYPNGVDKLMGAYHKDFCRALARDGRMKVNMLCIDRQGISSIFHYLRMEKKFVDKQDGYDVYGFRMLDVSKLNFDLQIKRYAAHMLFAYQAYEKLHGRPDVLHAHVSVPAGYAASIVSKQTGIPVLMTEHASYYDRFFNGIEARYNGTVMEQAKITCVSDFMRKLYAEKGIAAEVLPNIVECGQFFLPRASRPANRFELISVCALRDATKRVDNIVSAVKLLQHRIPQIHYTVVGDGGYQSQYKNHCRDAGMDDAVTFVGRKSHDEIAQLLTGMDALVVASDFETFGIPAVEALAAGIPVVSTRNFGTESFLNDKCSILCKVNDVEDLARAIGTLYDRYGEFSEEYNRSVAASFDGARVADMAYGYYRQLLETNERR